MFDSPRRQRIAQSPRMNIAPVWRWTRPFAVAMACALGAFLMSPDARAQGAGASWTTPAGTLQGTRFSTLTDITSANVSRLVEDFSFSTGMRGSHEGQPLVVGTILYIVTPFPNKLIALDLANGGKELWTYSPAVSPYARGVACCDVVNRGAAYANGQIVFALLDDSVVAVNALTGKQTWRTSLGDPHTGMTMSGAPIIVGDKVIVGNSGGELGIRGWVAGLSLTNGGLVWRAYSTGPDVDVLLGPSFHPFYAKDRGVDLGVTTWPTGNLWAEGGGTVWAWLTYDPELNLVFYGTSNPGVWDPDARPGDNKWGASVFARNPDTGEAVWAYQLTPHDNWDFDAISENIAVDLPFNGVTRKLLVQFDKNGYAYTFDRATGEVLVAKPFETVNWSTSINLTTGLPALDPAKQSHEGVFTNNICPTPLGGKDYEPAAFSPATKLFYVPAINLCYNFQALKAIFIRSTPFTGADLSFFPGPGGNLGELVAWDAVKGVKTWSIKEPLPLYGGVLATAGNVVFYGTLDKQFKAIDATTGAVLFQTQLECGIGSNPISFTGADGKQRIAVYSGIGWLPGGFAGGACPKGGWGGAAVAGAPTSGVLHVFKLP